MKTKEDMTPFKSTNLIEFNQRFRTENDCRKYLMELKWGKGFKCSRCGSKSEVRSKMWYYKRCRMCNYDESVTSGTILHKVKFPLLKAFHIIYRLSISKKGCSSVQLAKEFGISQKTAWLFRQKVQIAMKSSGKVKLSKKVHVDEFTVGGPEEGAPGRSDGSKNKIIIGVEARMKNGKAAVGLAYAQCIEDYSADSFRPFFETRIEKDACIETDGFTTYKALKDNYNIRQYYSDKGLRFPKLHSVIMNLKSWLRGMHHKCKYGYMQKYLDEFIFRFNRRNKEDAIFHTLIQRLMSGKPSPVVRIYELSH